MKGAPDAVDAAPAVDPDYPVEPVPPHARKSLFSLTVVLVGFALFTPTMLAGAQVGAAFRFTPLLGVLLLGSAVLGAYVGVIGWIGAKTNFRGDQDRLLLLQPVHHL